MSWKKVLSMRSSAWSCKVGEMRRTFSFVSTATASSHRATASRSKAARASHRTSLSPPSSPRVDMTAVEKTRMAAQAERKSASQRTARRAATRCMASSAAKFRLVVPGIEAQGIGMGGGGMLRPIAGSAPPAGAAPVWPIAVL